MKNMSKASKGIHGSVSASADEADPIPVATAVKKPRGFAAMDRAKVREIASLGGVAAHKRGTAHQFTSEEARQAGQKGGVAPHKVRGRGRAAPKTQDAAAE